MMTVHAQPSQAVPPSPPTADKECVILLHGLARRARSMAKIESALRDAGYCVINDTYPSTRHALEKLADDAVSDTLAQCPTAPTIHFVTHSMGGILLRQYLSCKSIARLGRVVMLAPPNKGSMVVDKLQHVPLLKRFFGPAFMQLRAGLPNQPTAVNFQLGVIAGNRRANFILSTLLPRPNDGIVSVESTRLDGMSDHITLPVTHAFMMQNKTVIRQVLHFLKDGFFKREKD